MEGNPTCRICLETENPEEMISPCQCRGTQKYVHRYCLNQWREQHVNESYYRCTECHYRYKISRVWWGKIIAHKSTSIILSCLCLTTGACALGYSSSAGYNKIFYWFHHQPYMRPHRMQTLFHSVAWIGIPGLWMGAKKLFSGAFIQEEGEGEREGPHLSELLSQAIGRGIIEGMVNYRRYQPREVHHYHHREEKKDVNVPAEEESPENSDDDEETRLRKRRNKRKREREEKKPKVAPYEAASTGTWVALLGGVVCSFYFTYDWAYKKCQNLCNSVQGRVENIS